jgi:hypothetical protein
MRSYPAAWPTGRHITTARSARHAFEQLGFAIGMSDDGNAAGDRRERCGIGTD